MPGTPGAKVRSEVNALRAEIKRPCNARACGHVLSFETCAGGPGETLGTHGWVATPRLRVSVGCFFRNAVRMWSRTVMCGSFPIRSSLANVSFLLVTVVARPVDVQSFTAQQKKQTFARIGCNKTSGAQARGSPNVLILGAYTN